MKKASKYLSHITLGMLISGAFFIAAPAFAQTSNFVIFQQGQIVNNLGSGITTQGYWGVKIGNGYTGTTTGAFAAVSGSINGSQFQVRVAIDGYADNSYSSAISVCRFYSFGSPSGIYVATSSNPFLQLNHYAAEDVGTGCVLDPAKYYVITMGSSDTSIDFMGIDPWNPPSGWEIANTIRFSFPQFSIVGSNFQIVPTNQTTGLYLSGAQEFCNQYFSSSTNPISGLANDFGNAICQAVGYLFVPTQSSIQQFSAFPSAAANVLPFSYFYGLVPVFEGFTASSTENFPTYSMGLSQIDFASSTAMGPIFPSNLEFLSSTTINKFMPVGMHDLLYNLMIFVIWVDVAFVLYHKVVPKKANI